MRSFIPGIQVYAYANEHTPKRKMVRAVYFQVLQAVVIEDPVVQALTSSALLVNIPILLGIPWDAWLEAQVPFVLYVDGAPIAARGALGGMGALLDPAAFERAAVFMGIFARVISPWTHFVPRPAERMAFLVESDVIGAIFRRFCPAVDVNQCVHVPMFQQFISGDVVVCGIEADVFGGKAKGIASEIVNGIEEIFAVMPPGIGKFHEQGKIYFKGIISGTEHV